MIRWAKSRRPPPSGLDRLGLHDHACHLYRTREERISTLAAFLRTGLDRGEICIHLTGGGSECGVIESELASFGLDAAAMIAAGALVIAEPAVFFGRRFDPAQAIALLEDAAEAARVAGFAGLRVAAEMSWLVAEQEPPQVAELESGLDGLLALRDLVGLCQYDCSRIDPALLRDALRTHPMVAVEEALRRNPHFAPGCPPRSQAGAEAELHQLIDALTDPSCPAGPEQVETHPARVPPACGG